MNLRKFGGCKEAYVDKKIVKRAAACHLACFCAERDASSHKNWGLEINLKKSKVMFISKKAQLVRKEDAPRIGSQSLEFVECYKYLGLVVYSNGKLLQTASNLCTRGWKAIFKLNLSLRGCDTKAQLRLKLFDTLVKPILCYGAEVWGGLITRGTTGGRNYQLRPLSKWRRFACAVSGGQFRGFQAT